MHEHYKCMHNKCNFPHNDFIFSTQLLRVTWTVRKHKRLKLRRIFKQLSSTLLLFTFITKELLGCIMGVHMLGV